MQMKFAMKIKFKIISYQIEMSATLLINEKLFFDEMKAKSCFRSIL